MARLRQNISIRKIARRKDGQAKYTHVNGTHTKQYVTPKRESSTTRQYRTIRENNITR